MNEVAIPTLAFIFGGLELGLIPALLLIFLNIVATRKSIRFTEGVAVPVWLAFIWLVPFIGAICALVAIRKRPIID